MSTLIDLINFRDELTGKIDEFTGGLDHFIDSKGILLKIIQINNFNAGYDSEIDQAINDLDGLRPIFDNIIANLKNMLYQVDQQIHLVANQTFNTPEFQNNFVRPDEWQPALIFNSQLEDTIRVRIRQYSDWRFPGLQMHTKSVDLINCMVPCDPLYLLDDELTKLTNLTSVYPQQYQNRLRLYTTNQIQELPQDQFGFVLVWNFLEFMSHEQVTNILQTIYNLLRPGGYLMFTYSNGDEIITAKQILANRFNYNNERQIEKTCREIGFEIVAKENMNNNGQDPSIISWFEIKKPGDLKTIRAHQILGQIIPK